MQQLTLEGRTEYQWPLTPDDRQELFDQWRAANPAIMRYIEQQALRLNFAGKRVSVRYLIELVRYETHLTAVPVPFRDRFGIEHRYRINNSDTALIARHLLWLHPELNIETRRALTDEVVA